MSPIVKGWTTLRALCDPDGNFAFGFALSRLTQRISDASTAAHP
jgi:hypothetical protein